MNQQELEQHHAFSHMKLDPMLEYRQDCLLDNVTTGFLPEKYDYIGGLQIVLIIRAVLPGADEFL